VNGRAPRLGLAEPAAFVRLSATVPSAAAFPSIAARHPAANWFEREVMDAFARCRRPPNPNRRLAARRLPEDAFELRKASTTAAVRGRRAVPAYRPVTGEGVFHIPVGPVHAGIIEPGHFRFGVAGEPVLYLQLRLFYVHRDREALRAGLPGATACSSRSRSRATRRSVTPRLRPRDRAAGRRRASAAGAPPAGGAAPSWNESTTTWPTSAPSPRMSPSPCPASRGSGDPRGAGAHHERCSARACCGGTIALGGVKGDLTPSSARLRPQLVRLGRRFDDLVQAADRLRHVHRPRRRHRGAADAGGARARVVGVARGRRASTSTAARPAHDAYRGLRFEVPVEAAATCGPG